MNSPVCVTEENKTRNGESVDIEVFNKMIQLDAYTSYEFQGQ